MVELQAAMHFARYRLSYVVTVLIENLMNKPPNIRYEPIATAGPRHSFKVTHAYAVTSELVNGDRSGQANISLVAGMNTVWGPYTITGNRVFRQEPFLTQVDADVSV